MAFDAPSSSLDNPNDLIVGGKSASARFAQLKNLIAHATSDNAVEGPVQDLPPDSSPAALDDATLHYNQSNTSDSSSDNNSLVFFAWAPRAGQASTVASLAESTDGGRNYLTNLTSETTGLIKVGCVVLFGDGRDGANHAAMCIGFDAKTGTPVWCSDAVQKGFFVNAATRNGNYKIYQPPAGFNGQEAANYIRMLAGKRTDSSGRIIGDKSITQYTELCAQHVRLAIDHALGKDIERAGNANQYGPSLLAAGFTEIVSGHGTAPTAQIATARTSKGPPSHMG